MSKCDQSKKRMKDDDDVYTDDGAYAARRKRLPLPPLHAHYWCASVEMIVACFGTCCVSMEKLISQFYAL